MGNIKPKKCCYPNCFECPYSDCRYDRMEVEDYTESNKRDYDFYEQDTGHKLHKGPDEEYRKKRQVAYQRNNKKYVDRHEYNQQYYKEHGDEIKESKREQYDTKKNTRICRKYRKKHSKERKEYDKQYYQKNKQKKIAQALKRYYKNKSL